jgi:triosephosphate isomerase (TIM)
MDASRTLLLAANWKAHQHWDDCEAYAAQLRRALPGYFRQPEDEAVEVLLCPPLPYIAVLGSLLNESGILLGAQDVSRFKEGAHTGEVSAAMLSDVGCDYCIVGHSERRALGEDDELVKQKLRQLVEAELIPILCVGESAETRDGGIAPQFVLAQLEAVRDELAAFPAEGLVIAYEPIWAIGTGRNAEPADALEMAAAIRGWLAGLGAEFAEQVPILYGGSVKPDNIGGYLEQADIDGALIGGASLEAQALAQMVQVARELRTGSRGERAGDHLSLL